MVTMVTIHGYYGYYGDYGIPEQLPGCLAISLDHCLHSLAVEFVLNLLNINTCTLYVTGPCTGCFNTIQGNSTNVTMVTIYSSNFAVTVPWLLW